MDEEYEPVNYEAMSEEEFASYFDEVRIIFNESYGEFERLVKNTDSDDPSFPEMDRFYEYLDGRDDLVRVKQKEFEIISPLFNTESDTNELLTLDNFNTREKAINYIERVQRAIDFYSREIMVWNQVFLLWKGGIKRNN